MSKFSHTPTSKFIKKMLFVVLFLMVGYIWFDRQHWFISRLDGASVTAGGFTPHNNNVFIITTSSNQLYVLDVEAKQLGDWSMRHTNVLPRSFLEFPGEIIGLSFPPSNSTSVIIYSARAMCLIDFGMPVIQDDDANLPNGLESPIKKVQGSPNNVTTGAKRKRNNSILQLTLKGRKNFDFSGFKDPVLFVGHLSENSLLVIEKPWRQVVQTFEAPPVHRHIFGT